MSIYDNPLSYARMTRIPLSLSKIWCSNQLEIDKIVEAAKACPKCGKATLSFEGGDYYEGTRDVVYCENDEIPYFDEDEGEQSFMDCDYVAEPTGIHEPLSPGFDFDTILAHSHSAEMFGACFDTLQEWISFVKREVAEITPKLSA